MWQFAVVILRCVLVNWLIDAFGHVQLTACIGLPGLWVAAVTVATSTWSHHHVLVVPVLAVTETNGTKDTSGVSAALSAKVRGLTILEHSATHCRRIFQLLQLTKVLITVQSVGQINFQWSEKNVVRVCFYHVSLWYVRSIETNGSINFPVVVQKSCQVSTSSFGQKAL